MEKPEVFYGTLIRGEEAPDDLKDLHIYFIEGFDHVMFLCPCGCEEVVHIPTGDDGWKLKIEEGRVTLAPSLLRRDNCRSHFFIESSRVRWA